jgi:transglutaminase-like putative cysteine protease
VTLFRPLPRGVARTGSLLMLVAWIATMGVLLARTFVQARSMNLATDLARYGPAAEWRGVYYQGDKIGFTVSQTTPVAGGFELQEDSRLQMSLLGETTPATIETKAALDQDFVLRSFDFSLDPGTGAVHVAGTVEGKRVSLVIATATGQQHETRDLREVPVLSLNLPRRLAAEGLRPGLVEHWEIFDPATLSVQPVTLAVGKREVISAYVPVAIRLRGHQIVSDAPRPVPAFRVDMNYGASTGVGAGGLHTTSWITDTGEVVREESPLGLYTVREPPEVARRMAISGRTSAGLLESAAVVPALTTKKRINDPRDVRMIRLKLDGADLTNPDLQGAGQRVDGDVIEIRDARTLQPGPAEHDLATYLAPEPLIESDDPDIHAAALAAIGDATDPRAQAERLTRRVNAMLDKKPTVGLPDAREVLRTKVGDCNEHTALYVAMARSIGLPARIAVGLVYARGAFYYHAWPEVYVAEGGPSTGSGASKSGLWLPVDPTFNQFPADATHVRLARGGLDKQAAIIPLIGHVKMNILDLDLAPNANPILVGRRPAQFAELPVPFAARVGMTCWMSPAHR